jgi:hypothetical protein
MMKQKHVVLFKLITEILFSEDGSSMDCLHAIVLEHTKNTIRRDRSINHERELTGHLHARPHPEPQR